MFFHLTDTALCRREAVHLQADETTGISGIPKVSTRHAVHPGSGCVPLGDDPIVVPLAVFERTAGPGFVRSSVPLGPPRVGPEIAGGALLLRTCLALIAVNVTFPAAVFCLDASGVFFSYTWLRI